MFVSRTRYNDTLKELIQSRKDTVEANRNFLYACEKHEELKAQWNELVGRINARGGEAFLSHTAEHNVFTDGQLSPEDIRSLLRLVHPDKHQGREVATKMFQKLSDMVA